MALTLKEKEIIKPTKLNELGPGDTFTFEDDPEPYIVLDEKPDNMFQVVGLETGVIYRYVGEDTVFKRNYILEEVS